MNLLIHKTGGYNLNSSTQEVDNDRNKLIYLFHLVFSWICSLFGKQPQNLSPERVRLVTIQTLDECSPEEAEKIALWLQMHEKIALKLSEINECRGFIRQELIEVAPQVLAATEVCYKNVEEDLIRILLSSEDIIKNGIYKLSSLGYDVYQIEKFLSNLKLIRKYREKMGEDLDSVFLQKPKGLVIPEKIALNEEGLALIQDLRGLDKSLAAILLMGQKIVEQAIQVAASPAELSKGPQAHTTLMALARFRDLFALCQGEIPEALIQTQKSTS